jgi:ABC-type polysaccharide/polyol phosphate export permease
MKHSVMQHQRSLSAPSRSTIEFEDGALPDLRASIRMLPVALIFAWGDTKARYRRSVLGPFWIVLGTAIGVAGLGYVWSAVLKVDRASFVPSITIGLVVWQFIGGVIGDAPTVLVRSSQTIRNIRTPYLFFCFQSILRQLVNLAHNAIVVIVVLAVYQHDWNWRYLLVVPGLILVIVNLAWMAIIGAILGARFRDLDPLVAATMPLLFFISPVIFRQDQLPAGDWILNGNLLAHFIRAIRDPLQGLSPEWYVYAVLVAALVVGWSMALRLLNARYSQIAFWV